MKKLALNMIVGLAASVLLSQVGQAAECEGTFKVQTTGAAHLVLRSVPGSYDAIEGTIYFNNGVKQYLDRVDGFCRVMNGKNYVRFNRRYVENGNNMTQVFIGDYSKQGPNDVVMSGTFGTHGDPNPIIRYWSANSNYNLCQGTFNVTQSNGRYATLNLNSSLGSISGSISYPNSPFYNDHVQGYCQKTSPGYGQISFTRYFTLQNGQSGSQQFSAQIEEDHYGIIRMSQGIVNIPGGSPIFWSAEQVWN